MAGGKVRRVTLSSLKGKQVLPSLVPRDPFSVSSRIVWRDWALLGSGLEWLPV